ncbi:hypothetical protein GCM10010289_69020 [Streptomyces violascens]|nr:hypothetical protein GCM10010289_69020 [Streptomyces violascens]
MLAGRGEPSARLPASNRFLSWCLKTMEWTRKKGLPGRGGGQLGEGLAGSLGKAELPTGLVDGGELVCSSRSPVEEFRGLFSGGQNAGVGVAGGRIGLRGATLVSAAA